MPCAAELVVLFPNADSSVGVSDLVHYLQSVSTLLIDWGVLRIERRTLLGLFIELFKGFSIPGFPRDKPVCTSPVYNGRSRGWARELRILDEG